MRTVSRGAEAARGGGLYRARKRFKRVQLQLPVQYARLMGTRGAINKFGWNGESRVLPVFRSLEMLAKLRTC